MPYSDLSWYQSGMIDMMSGRWRPVELREYPAFPPVHRCTHKPTPSNLLAYTQQLLAYFKQVFPTYKLPSDLEAAKICCQLEHYKKLKK